MKIKNRKTEKNNGKKRSLIITNFVIVVVSGDRPNATQKPKRWLGLAAESHAWYERRFYISVQF